MNSIIDSITVQVFNSFDQTPIEFSSEELFLALLTCKNVTDLCETGIAILNQMEPGEIEKFPSVEQIELCRSVLQRFYSDDMFNEDEELGLTPIWSEIKRLDETKSTIACRIYRGLMRNITSKGISDAISKRDSDYFVKNFDSIFENLPEQFKNGLNKFKTFIASPKMTDEHRDCIWEYFESLLEIFLHEDEYIKILKN